MLRPITLVAPVAASYLLLAAAPVDAAPLALTSKGRISAEAVASLLIEADKGDAPARVAFAYIAGSVEATLAASEAAKASGGKPLICKDGPGKLEAQEIIDVFKKVAPDTSKWSELEAGPVMVSLLVSKYPCR